MAITLTGLPWARACFVIGQFALWPFGREAVDRRQVTGRDDLLASAVAGALLAAVLTAALMWRVRGRAPAATTARLAELQSRIRPHFLFNTLNTIASLTRTNPDKARNLLREFSVFYRRTLEGSQSLIPPQ